MLITKQSAFDSLCDRLLKERSIALDTEFMRRNTYHPLLSLMQIATKTETFIVDTLKLELEKFKEILLNKRVLKIFHAPKQDFEIFYYLFKIPPVNIFDTQIAAAFCDFRKAISYADLCSAVCGITLDKAHQASNWLARPLPADMLEYALKDVEYLHDIYEHLSPLIKDRAQYREQIVAQLTNEELYKFNPQNAWKKVKIGTRSEAFVERMKILAAFREEIAEGLDIPRGHFISDVTLIQLCSSLPKNDGDFHQIREKTRLMQTEKYKNKILDLCVALKNIK